MIKLSDNLQKSIDKIIHSKDNKTSENSIHLDIISPMLCSIIALWKIYPNESFVDFYEVISQDKIKAVISKMDGYCVLHNFMQLNNQDKEEIAQFFNIIGCNTLLSCINNELFDYGFKLNNSGIIMKLDKIDNIIPVKINQKNDIHDFKFDYMPSPRDIYKILEFNNGQSIQLGNFDSWYVDISHRLRHEYCHAVILKYNNKSIGCAMTLSEYNNTAIIGGVSIIPEMQGKGFGKIIMNTLQNYIKAKHIFVLVNNKNNTGFYFNLGYKPYGRFITQGI